MTARSLSFFLARRLAALVGLLVIISFGVFSLLYLAPGDTALALTRGRPVPPEVLAELRVQYHLDEPFLTQYWIWLTNALHGDLGESTVSGLSVVDTIKASLPVSVFLGVYAFLLTMVVGVPLGVAAALRKRSLVDRGIVGLSVAGVSMPVFVTGILLLYLFAVQLALFPAFGGGEGFVDRLDHLTLPAIALAVTNSAFILKLTRAGMIESLDQDYVAFARARGLPKRRVVSDYALRNALIPVTTAAGIVLGFVITQSVIVEVVFGVPGIGWLLIESVTFKDIPMVQGLALLIATVIIVVNALTDIIYVLIDPRIRFQAGAA